jgi:hypothetical protein
MTLELHRLAQYVSRIGLFRRLTGGHLDGVFGVPTGVAGLRCLTYAAFTPE